MFPGRELPHRHLHTPPPNLPHRPALPSQTEMDKTVDKNDPNVEIVRSHKRL